MAYIIIKKEEASDFLAKYVNSREDEFKQELVNLRLLDEADLDDNSELAFAARDYLEDYSADIPFNGVYWGSDSRDDEEDPWTLYTGGDIPEAFYYILGDEGMSLDEIRVKFSELLPEKFDFEGRAIVGIYDGMVAIRNSWGMPVWASPWDEDTAHLIPKETDFDFMADLLGSKEKSRLFWESAV